MNLPAIVPVRFRGGLVALVSERRIHIVAPWLLTRPTGDPELRSVGFMCACAAETIAGRVSGPFTSELAESWVREALIAAGLSELTSLSDAAAARRLNVPTDQVRIARCAVSRCPPS